MLNMKLIHPASGALIDMMKTLNDEGHEAHLVGGAVRDALLGRPVKDLDISTSAHPETVMSLFSGKGFAVHPTGIDHGTVTVVMENEPFEVTTWRRDVATDGRRAVVAFADNIADDAFRRDLTINALYADRLGNIMDPTGQGLEDIKNLRLRFVGDATQRIREDALRILRFFRFHSVLGISVERGEGLKACIQEAGLLGDLSRERIGWEMQKLLTGQKAGLVFSEMVDTGVADGLLPGCDLNPGEIRDLIERLDHACKVLEINRSLEITLAAMTETTPADAYRLPGKTSKCIDIVRNASAQASSPEELGYRLGEHAGLSALAVRFAILRSPAPLDRDPVLHGARQVFGIKAKDLDPGLKGKQIGEELRRLEQEWILSGFDTPLSRSTSEMSPWN